MKNIEWATWATAIGTLALAGAAFVLARRAQNQEVAQGSLRRWEAGRDQAIEDLDETRRLLVIIIHKREALASAELFGTIIHALVNHSHLIEDANAAAIMLTRWQRDGSGLAELEGYVSTLDTRLHAMRSLPPLSALPLL